MRLLSLVVASICFIQISSGQISAKSGFSFAKQFSKALARVPRTGVFEQHDVKFNIPCSVAIWQASVIESSREASVPVRETRTSSSGKISGGINEATVNQIQPGTYTTKPVF